MNDEFLERVSEEKGGEVRLWKNWSYLKHQEIIAIFKGLVTAREKEGCENFPQGKYSTDC